MALALASRSVVLAGRTWRQIWLTFLVFCSAEDMGARRKADRMRRCAYSVGASATCEQAFGSPPSHTHPAWQAKGEKKTACSVQLPFGDVWRKATVYGLRSADYSRAMRMTPPLPARARARPAPPSALFAFLLHPACRFCSRRRNWSGAGRT